ncbi:hypothetical protein AFLA_010737 [Aspergillus flavus NRRL3357]|nr:hypothetical protein AFLA_010737 [Aspergillus flavus NRRL3357]
MPPRLPTQGEKCSSPLPLDTNEQLEMSSYRCKSFPLSASANLLSTRLREWYLDIVKYKTAGKGNSVKKMLIQGSTGFAVGTL